MDYFPHQLPAHIPAYGEVYVYGLRRKAMQQIIARELESELGFSVKFHDGDADDVMLVARRLNFVNLGTDARLVLVGGIDVQHFAQLLSDVDDETPGDKVVRSARLERSILFNQFALHHLNLAASPAQSEFSRECNEWDTCLEVDLNISPSYLEPDECEAVEVDDERERDLEELRAKILAYVAKYHTDPTSMLAKEFKGKIVLNPDGFSRVVVNGNTQIVLADYDETEVKMGARERTLYIFFLKHPEGMRQVEIADHRDELLRIYSLVKPGASDSTARTAVDNLCDPIYGTLSECISRIKKAVKHVIRDEKIAPQYYIDGKRGHNYRIALNPDLVALPRALTT